MVFLCFLLSLQHAAGQGPQHVPGTRRARPVWRTSRGRRCERARSLPQSPRHTVEAIGQHARWEAFLKNSRVWRAVREHREFLARARDTCRATGAAAEGALAAHLDFAERKLVELAPLADPSSLVPQVPTPKPDDLNRS